MSDKAKKLEGFRKFMLDKGYKFLVVHYDGAGDSGDFYEMEGYKTVKSFNARNLYSEYISHYDWEGDTRIDLSEKEAYSKGTRNQYSVFKALKEWNKTSGENIDAGHIADLITYDWYNNDGGQGWVVFDLKNKTIKVEGERNYMESESITETLYTDNRPSELHY